MCHYPDPGSASDWSCRKKNLLQPIRNTTQIWVVTRHHYGISALVSFRGETSRGVAKCRLHSFHFAGKPVVALQNVGHFLSIQLLLMLFSETKIFLHRSIHHIEFGETATLQKIAHSRKCESLKL